MSRVRVMCVPCNGYGTVWPELSALVKYRKLDCPVCNGTKMDPIPWAELYSWRRESPIRHDEDVRGE